MRKLHFGGRCKSFEKLCLGEYQISPDIVLLIHFWIYFSSHQALVPLITDHTCHRNVEQSPQKLIITYDLINKLHIREDTLNNLRNTYFADIGLISDIFHLDQSKINDHVIYFFIPDPP